jgi:hypothetical protein
MQTVPRRLRSLRGLHRIEVMARRLPYIAPGRLMIAAIALLPHAVSARTLTVPLMKTSRAMDIDRWLSSSGLQRSK